MADNKASSTNVADVIIGIPILGSTQDDCGRKLVPHSLMIVSPRLERCEIQRAETSEWLILFQSKGSYKPLVPTEVYLSEHTSDRQRIASLNRHPWVYVTDAVVLNRIVYL